jgi:hypothetical protein
MKTLTRTRRHEWDCFKSRHYKQDVTNANVNLIESVLLPEIGRRKPVLSTFRIFVRRAA